LDFIGITLRDPQLAGQVRDMVARVTDGRYEMVTAEESGGGLIALITTPREIAAIVREALSGERLPELPFPSTMADLPFVARVQRLRERLDDLGARIATVDAELEQFARQWGALYRRVQEWLDERITLLQASATVRETGMCFVVRGWIAAAERERLVQALNGSFGGRVVVTEKRILEQDLERVPVLLRNPPYFRPFEIFTHLLPLPRYSSYDPTPFIAIFFPIFFGMMLGDAGHGLLLVLISLAVKRWGGRRPVLRDVGQVFLISASYAVIFGILYGEFFGELGEELFGLHPLWLARGKAIMPMLWFTIAIGTAHVLLGLVLGFLAALRKRTGKEALARLVNILLIILLAALVVSVVIPSPWLLTRPILVMTGLLVPFLLITGGFLAPLELLKNIGNIISYTRIMAIGLSSVLLANVANRMAGISGDIIIGTLAAILLHGVSLVLGVFAPTIHGLRLHFVEFFSKFLEHGGREFTPLKKKHQT
ncbi:MAG TPA: V-type ATPase 116kDa subunit family protein, partial [Geobacteraceae bacterium]